MISAHILIVYSVVALIGGMSAFAFILGVKSCV